MCNWNLWPAHHTLTPSLRHSRITSVGSGTFTTAITHLSWNKSCSRKFNLSEGVFNAGGIYGQSIYVNPTRRVVIVQTSWHGPESNEQGCAADGVFCCAATPVAKKSIARKIAVLIFI
jgi:hypothetical protein